MDAGNADLTYSTLIYRKDFLGTPYV